MDAITENTKDTVYTRKIPKGINIVALITRTSVKQPHTVLQLIPSTMEQKQNNEKVTSNDKQCRINPLYASRLLYHQRRYSHHRGKYQGWYFLFERRPNQPQMPIITACKGKNVSFSLPTHTRSHSTYSSTFYLPSHQSASS